MLMAHFATVHFIANLSIFLIWMSWILKSILHKTFFICIYSKHIFQTFNIPCMFLYSIKEISSWLRKIIQNIGTDATFGADLLRKIKNVVHVFN